MELSEVSCKRGAPMGRAEHHCYGIEGIVFELEWVPFTDGGYDAGGAYWGTPNNLYWAIGTLDGEEVVSCFLRNINRENAMRTLCDDYPGCTFAPENGSLIKQMIKFLNKYLEDEEDPLSIEKTEEEVSALESILEDKGIDHD